MRAPASAAAARGGKSRDPSAHHQHVDGGGLLLVVIGVGRGRGTPEAGHAADRRLEPVPVRPHERLVVEAGRQERRRSPGQCAEVEADARPAVDALRDQALRDAAGASRARWACAGRRGPRPRCALGSSRPHDQTPRGRWSLKLRPTSRTPLASSAEASVSPAKPRSARPLKVNDTSRERSIHVPAGAASRSPATLGPEPRRRIAHAVHREYVVRHGVARDVEPLPAPARVPPALEVHALGVVAEEEIVAPVRIRRRERRSLDVGRSAAHELGLVAQATPRTAELHHVAAPQCAIPEAAASSISRPVTKRSSWKASASS